MGAKKQEPMQDMAIRSIRVDHDLQSRVEMNMDIVKDYADALMTEMPKRELYQFPPVVVYFDDKVHWLADGFHRVAAYKRAGRASIPADVRAGTRRDALLFSVGANLKMGMHPTAADKRKAVRMLLADPGCFLDNNTEIGRRCGVSPGVAKRIRAEFCLEKGIPIPEATNYQRHDGKIMKAPRFATPGVPSYRLHERPGQKPRAITYVNGQRIVLGVDSSEARAKFDAIKAEWEKRQGSNGFLSRPGSFIEWLSTRGVPCQATGYSADHPRGLLLPTAALCVCPGSNPDSIYQAIGRVRLFRRHALPDGRAVVAFGFSNTSDTARALIDLARRDGVEFLTPEEIVAEFGPKPEDAAAPAPPAPSQ